MSSINGIDPIIVDTIKIQTQKQIVTETKKSKISKDKQERQRGQDQNETAAPDSRQPLPAAIDRLNRLLEEHHVPLFFRTVGDKKAGRSVQLVHCESQAVIKDFYPEQVFKMLKDFSTRGFTINQLI